ncbi:MAG: hypothetical protein CVV57_00530 [Tenericutes bacterium HGW-Tenericutes-2]|jgi:hypothetical protein|nr:MAG: hypothetical protein CVV57_00530 [Tenericutes bacterium HGW-Tenericutes-2]
MRKIIGFIFFVISMIILITAVMANIELINGINQVFQSENISAALYLYLGVVWQLLAPTIIILLLSVIAMGNYSRRR